MITWHSSDIFLPFFKRETTVASLDDGFFSNKSDVQLKVLLALYDTFFFNFKNDRNPAQLTSVNIKS